jgi:hypothetical protein
MNVEEDRRGCLIGDGKEIRNSTLKEFGIGGPWIISSAWRGVAKSSPAGGTHCTLDERHAASESLENG